MMMGRDSGQPAVAGGPAPHIPVLGPQAVALLAVRTGGVYVDATFGAGGHSRAILAAGNVKVLGLDRDPAAIALGADLVERAAGRLTLVEANFADLDSVAREFGFAAVEGVLLDLGVSSMQLDHAERGFSFRLEGQLDMRMSASGPSAADILARAPERELASIIAALGEERQARGVARAIVAARRRQAIRTTAELAAIVARVVRTRPGRPGRPGEIHPATRTFQALRIFVNDELRSLAAALNAAERLLAPGGRLVAIAFHSLEDRIVKTFLAARGRPPAPSRHLPERARAAPSFQILTKRPIVPDAAELAANPRARSAKLRAAERTSAAAHPQPAEVLLRLPTPDEIMGRK
jgi:16S rRNA (cytosine1402-N4)-methyltransferase